MKSSVVLLLACNIPIVLSLLTPAEVAKKVGDSFIHNADHFIFWGYGGAIVVDGLYRANRTFGIDYASQLTSHLNAFTTNPAAYGYKLLHGEAIAFGGAVGDSLGLFPIAYLRRYETTNESNPDDLLIAKKVADQYILGWPKRLADGTFSRDASWSGERDGNHSILWIDDMYMGLTLLARLSIYEANESRAEQVLKQQLTFSGHLQDESDGVFYHGYNDLDGHNSCCKWGRGNGWAFMSHVEALQMKMSNTSQNYKETLKIFQRQAAGLAKYQAPNDGRFHQVVNETTTFLETSATAMFLTSFIRGVMNNWLPYDDYKSVIENAWAGLVSTVQANGTVTGICDGTGIQANVADYERRPTSYLSSAGGGVGAVLYAAADMEKFRGYEMERERERKANINV